VRGRKRQRKKNFRKWLHAMMRRPKKCAEIIQVQMSLLTRPHYITETVPPPIEYDDLMAMRFSLKSTSEEKR
jgi:hypothetical protein